MIKTFSTVVLFGAILTITTMGFAADALPPGAWKFGHTSPKVDARGMALGGHEAEATLTGTVMNPENLTNFTINLRWNFGGNGNGVFRVGWGKPFEWATFDHSLGWVTVQRDGLAKVYSHGQELGRRQLPVSDNGDVSLTVSRKAEGISLVSEGKVTSFPLADGQAEPGGYLVLRSEGYEKNGKLLHVAQADLADTGSLPPLSVAEQAEGIRQWEKGQVEGTWNILTNFQTFFKAHNGGRWEYATDVRIEPALVQPGEKVRVYFTCTGPVPATCSATVQANYLAETPGAIQPMVLHWHDTTDGAHEAVVDLKPKQAGNWHVVWHVGDEELSRVFGVVDDGYSVVRLMETSDRNLTKTNPAPAGFDAIHDAGLACNFWSVGNGISAKPESELSRYKRQLWLHHRWGDEVIPLMHADTLIADCPDKNVFKVSDDLQREGIEQLIQLWDLLGFGPLTDLGGYTYSDSTPQIASSLGIKSIDSLCQWQNWTDLGGNENGWQINNWGAPTVPYYIAKDDFRKVGKGRSIVALGQTSSSDSRIYTIYASEGQPQASFLRQHSYNGAMGESENIDRFNATMDLLMAESRYQSGPRFIFVALENFFDLPDWNEANRLGVQHLIETARHGKVVFAEASAIADYYQRHYAQQPENWFYWPDIYAGLRDSYKPSQLPDRIEVMNANFHTVFNDGSALPRFFWDYTQPWSTPIWDEQPAIRQKFGLLRPDLVNASNCVPPIVDLAGVSATVTIQTNDAGAEAQVVIESTHAVPTLPLALWRIPLDPQTVRTVKTSAHARYLKVVDGTTGNLHGMLVCRDVPAGRSVWTVKWKGDFRAPTEAEIHIGSVISGRYFPRANGPSAYLWLNDEHAIGGVLTLSVPSGRTVTLHYNDGPEEQTVGGALQVKLDNTWQHGAPMITGLTPEEIQDGARFQPTGL